MHIWITRPAPYKKYKQRFFEKNIFMFTFNFDPLIGIWGISDKKEKRKHTQN